MSADTDSRADLIMSRKNWATGQDEYDIQTGVNRSKEMRENELE